MNLFISMPLGVSVRDSRIKANVKVEIKRRVELDGDAYGYATLAWAYGQGQK